MNNTINRGSNHSAIVRMELQSGDMVVRVTHLGPGYFRTEKMIELPTNEARLTVSIDGVGESWPIVLEHGPRLLEKTIYRLDMSKVSMISAAA
jgi:hypothetical protein